MSNHIQRANLKNGNSHICVHCGKTYKTEPSVKTSKFCTRDCRHDYQRKKSADRLNRISLLKDILKTKVCKQCGLEKETSEFQQGDSFKDGYNPTCKKCIYKNQRDRILRLKRLDTGSRRSYHKCITEEEKYSVSIKCNLAREGGVSYPGLLEYHEWVSILKSQKNRCAVCGEQFTDKNKPTKDHIIPVSHGGRMTKENVQALCGRCNSSKFNHCFSGIAHKKCEVVEWL